MSYCQIQDGANKTLEQTSTNEEQFESVLEQLFSAVVTAMDGGRVLCQPFKVLPCRTVGYAVVL